MSAWETVIGLEVHVQLATRSKIFSGASTAFGAPPNSQASAVDLGLPGVLPVLNREAVRMAVRFGLAIGAQINRSCTFDRKNYFYPDLPKGYQISQFAAPIVGPGTLTIEADDGSDRCVRITRAHLEEDAGKSIHDAFDGATAIDLNRCGMPLLEVVSEPDMRSAAEAGRYLRQIHALVRYLGICDGNMNEGSLRCDANVSVRPRGSSELGERTEIKNVNSFRFLERAITHEAARHIEILEGGGVVQRETRLYDADRDETRSMRSKEFSDDYRYFPDPDLLPVQLDEEFIEAERDALPELPDAKRGRYETGLGLTAGAAAQLAQDPDRAAFFEAAIACGADARTVANWMLGELAAALNRDEIELVAAPITARALATLVQRIEDGTLSGKLAKTAFEDLWAGAHGGDVDAIIDARGLRQMSDTDALAALVRELVAANPKQAEQFRQGKDKVLGFFVGQVMKATQGKANPQQVNELLRDALTD